MNCLKSLIVSCVLLSVTVGCSRVETIDSRWRQENGKLKVLSTLSMIHDLAEQIGGERVDAIALIRGELDPHSYELVKGDDEKFARADLIFYNGLGLEHGLSLRQNLEHNPKAIAVCAKLAAEKPDLILSVDGQHDPHVWMDIALWMETVEPMVEAFAVRDPDHASEYRERGALLLQKMRAADEKVYAALQSVKSEKRYLVTSHDAFHYFTRHYLAAEGESDWQQRCRAPEGLSPEAQLSVSDVVAIITHVETFRISVLFPESNVSRDALRKIVDAGRQKGLTIRLCQESLYGDSMGGALSYLDMIIHNSEVIARELQHE